jgi:2-oxo-3-hexenedioate decarboxylase
MNNFIKNVAAKLHQAAKSTTPVAQISLEQTFSIDDAYAIQKAAINHRVEEGEEIIGVKMGFTSFAKMEQMGVKDMIWGILTDEMFVENLGNMSNSKFIHARAEPEIAFLVKKDIDREITLDEIPEYIEAYAPAVEIIDSRFENFKFSLEDVIADNCSSSAFAVGEWLPLPASLNDLDMRLIFDGNTVQSGKSNAILDNPYLSICHASRLCSHYGQPLLMGQIILAGAATSAEFIKGIKNIKVDISGVGEVVINQR